MGQANETTEENVGIYLVNINRLNPDSIDRRKISTFTDPLKIFHLVAELAESNVSIIESIFRYRFGESEVTEMQVKFADGRLQLREVL